MFAAYHHYLKHPAFLESEYPYTAREGSCKENKETKSPIKSIKGRHYLQDDVFGENLKKALTDGPVAVALDAGSSKFQFYQSGIVKNCYRNELNHAVTAVGWGVMANDEYFLIKNSWGSHWGDKGYIRLHTWNACGVCEEPVILEYK